MCGIVGCVENQGESVQSVIRGLTKLQNRGYDSSGVAFLITADDNKSVVHIEKAVSDVSGAVDVISQAVQSQVSTICIGHTRWATHGPKTLENAHPHQTFDKRVTLVHNGIIENYEELRSILLKKGYSFVGQTDSEVVANYYHYLLSISVHEPIRTLAGILRGSWAILMIVDGQVHFLRHGSPLLIGWSEDESKIMFASEFVGFDSDIATYSVLPDNSYGYIGSIAVCLSHELQINSMIQTELEHTPDPHLTWTCKEIHDQSTALQNLLSGRIRDGLPYFPEFNDIQINQIKHIIFLACGTSYHAAQIGAHMFRHAGLPVITSVIDGADFEPNYVIHKETMLFVLSQSGETKDLMKGLLEAKKLGVFTVGLINVENSLIAREVDKVIYMKSGREHAVASTKSFTNQIITLGLLAKYFTGQDVAELSLLPSIIEYVVDRSFNEIDSLLPIFKDQDHCFVLGKNADEWIAKEGALKIKEISYIHAEGFSSAALKHGPFALLSRNTPVIVLAPDNEHYVKSINCCAEIQARHAVTIGITNREQSSEMMTRQIYVPCSNKLFSYVAVIPLQILAYKLSLDRGINPDYPRNLAKVVTVE